MLATTVICIALSFPFAAFLVSLPRAIQRIMLVLVILPFWTSYLLRVYAWMTILGERGLINRGLMNIGVVDTPVRFLLYNDYSVVLVAVYLYIPYSALALYTNLERLDRSGRSVLALRLVVREPAGREHRFAQRCDNCQTRVHARSRRRLCRPARRQ